MLTSSTEHNESFFIGLQELKTFTSVYFDHLHVVCLKYLFVTTVNIH